VVGLVIKVVGLPVVLETSLMIELGDRIVRIVEAKQSCLHTRIASAISEHWYRAWQIRDPSFLTLSAIGLQHRTL
jgi:hypothetical protein